MPDDVIEVAYTHDRGFYLPGVHADGVRAALGVLRYLELHHTGERAMAEAIYTYLEWCGRHGVSVDIARMVAKHERRRRLAMSGKGKAAEVAAEMELVR